MSNVVAVELNDSGIVVSNGRQLLANSPGYSLKKQGECIVGKEAFKQAKLFPNDSYSGFWQSIATADAANLDRDAIDLVVRHMRAVWETADSSAHAAILTVPANFNKTALGVLLGVAKEVGIPVKALVHHAVLAPRQQDHQGVFLHVEVQLHNTTITQLVEQGDEFVVGEDHALESHGYEQIYARLAEVIAQQFVKETRFDPLHTADTEQQLYNSLQQWVLQSQSQSTIECQIHDGQQSHQVVVDSALIKKAGQTQIDKIIDKVLSVCPQESPVVCVPERLEDLLNFSEHAAVRGVATVSLESGHHANTVLQHAEKILDQEEQIYLIKQLPYFTVSQDTGNLNENRKAVTEAPSHLLFRHRAYAIQDSLHFSKLADAVDEYVLEASEPQGEPVMVIRNDMSGIWVEAVNDRKIYLNQRPVEAGSYPAIGDRLQVEGCEDELMFILVQN